MRYCAAEGAQRRVDFLSGREWDVVALQEVSQRAWEVITDSGIAESRAYTLEMFEPTPLRKRHHGVAPLARNGFRLSTPKLIVGLPKAERASREYARRRHALVSEADIRSDEGPLA